MNTRSFDAFKHQLIKSRFYQKFPNFELLKDCLTAQELTVICLFIGIDQEKPLSLSQIAKKLNIPKKKAIAIYFNTIAVLKRLHSKYNH